jgi:hypothetical protein
MLICMTVVALTLDGIGRLFVIQLLVTGRNVGRRTCWPSVVSTATATPKSLLHPGLAAKCTVTAFPVKSDWLAGIGRSTSPFVDGPLVPMKLAVIARAPTPQYVAAPLILTAVKADWF